MPYPLGSSVLVRLVGLGGPGLGHHLVEDAAHRDRVLGLGDVVDGDVDLGQFGLGAPTPMSRLAH